MNFQDRFPSDDKIWDYSNPQIVQVRAFKIYGPTAVIYRSKTKNKKYSIINPNGKIINFGQIGFEDYTKHKDVARRQNYLARANRIKGNWKDDGYSPNNLSIRLLW